ncbi:MAG: ABC transporter ATP-binding protein [Clostridiales bacterium]|nr:ABC transporter ATP-binding protein [Clostridiales bacterium]
MITLEHIYKIYYSHGVEFQALKDVSLTISDGDFIAIQGKSGAGKSTLLHILGGIDDYDTGTYRFNDTNVADFTNHQLAKLRNSEIGFVLQDFSLINHKSVLFNAMLPLYFNKTPAKDMKPMALNALRLARIEDQAKKPANQLSGGQRQRVAIARAIINNPSVILADEPTGSLDTETSAQIMDLLMSLNKQGITLVVVTHDNTVAGYAHRIITLRDGEILS